MTENLRDIPDIDSPRNWKEDFKDENGNYHNVCVYCQEDFIGHKMRVVCRTCHIERVEKIIEKTGQ